MKVESTIKGNLWIKSGLEGFKDGEFQGTTMEDGEIILEKSNGKYISNGIYISEVIYTLPFNYMVLSWNAETPKGTSLKIEAQVMDHKGKWSKWLSWGRWSVSRERASAPVMETEDDLVKVSTDTLSIKNGEVASALRYRLTLSREDSDLTPKVRLVAGTIRNTLPGQSIPSLYPEGENIPDLSRLDKEIDVPSYSQYLRDPEIAGYICSPTCITMILNFYGINLLPEEAAWGVYDREYEGFGNWPFNTAYAANWGFTSYVKYCDSVEDLKREIYLGRPTAVSVKYKNSEEVGDNLPVIHGAPISKTNGHIIVVCGFTHRDGKEYVIVNDSAAPSNEEVRRRYLIDEFDMAWEKSGRIAYIIR